MSSDNMHGRQSNPSQDEDFDTKPNSKSKTSQKTRDAHFLESGVNAQGESPKNLQFDAEGNPHKVTEESEA